MRNRINILKDLIGFEKSLSSLQEELKYYPWDVDHPILKIYKTDLVDILKKSIAGEITFDDLTAWANAIECRDDLEFEKDEIQEIVFELANPEINENITQQLLETMIIKLSSF